jgi:cyclase
MVPSETSAIPRRLIARLDIKGPNLVKGVRLEGLRVMGDPADHALRYYEEGIDELIYIDIVASLYGRNNLVEVVDRTASEIFVPLTVGGGIRTTDDIHTLLRAGADKVALNTAGIRNPSLITEASRIYGSQCIVLSIEAKAQREGGWEAYTDNGRERTGVDAVEWARRGVDLGAGEILLTSVDREGTRRGFDLPLIAAIAPNVSVPVIASGGAGSVEDIERAFAAGADAVAVASILHYGTDTVASIKAGLQGLGRSVRETA